MQSRLPRPRRSRSDGMILLEVLVALLLLCICAAGSVGMVLVTVRGNAFAGCIQTATRVGQHLIDQIMIEPFATLGVGGSACQIGVTETVYATGSTAVGGAGDTVPYQRTCTITPLPNGMKIVRVNVSWRDAADRLHSVDLGSQRAP